jgi:hypothetical protein
MYVAEQMRKGVGEAGPAARTPGLGDILPVAGLSERRPGRRSSLGRDLRLSCAGSAGPGLHAGVGALIALGVFAGTTIFTLRTRALRPLPFPSPTGWCDSPRPWVGRACTGVARGNLAHGGPGRAFERMATGYATGRTW